MSINFILYFITLIFINSINCLNCGDRNISHCLKCGKGEDDNKCALCEDKYFLFFHNLFCKPCNDSLYGQIGCDGYCDGSQYEKARMPLCNENDCNLQFYNFEGICIKCTNAYPHCLECNYNYLNGGKEGIFQCLKCVKPYYKVFNNKDRKCYQCHVINCKRCYFDENDNDACDECLMDYYVNENKTCSKCFWKDINGESYYYCPKKISERVIECYDGYTKNNSYNCLSCPTACRSCSYNSQSKTFNCSSCYPSYYLIFGECKKCPINCKSCVVNQNNILICTSCNRGYYIMGNSCGNCGPNCNSCNGNKCDICSSGFCNDNGQCIKCSENCLAYIKDTNGITRCKECYSSFALNSNNECLKCPNDCNSCYIKDNDFICTNCSSNNILFNNKCYSCYYDNSIGGNSCSTCSFSEGANKCYSCISNDYSFIYNRYKCLPNTNPEEEVFGCTNSSEINRIYECNTCKPGFILITNNKKCKKPEDMNLTYCTSAYNKNNKNYPIYSCNSCINNNKYVELYKIVNNIEIMNCVERTGKLIKCLKAKKHFDHNITFTNCMNNIPFIWRFEYNQSVCDEKCRFGKYLNLTDNWCHECDYLNKGCNSSFGCNYTSSNSQLNCYGCKPGYYLYFFNV